MSCQSVYKAPKASSSAPTVLPSCTEGEGQQERDEGPGIRSLLNWGGWATQGLGLCREDRLQDMGAVSGCAVSWPGLLVPMSPWPGHTLWTSGPLCSGRDS